MRQRFVSLIAAAAAGLVIPALPAGAGDPDLVDVLAPRPQADRYDGMVVVRVAPGTPQRLAAVTSLADDVWSCRGGVSLIDVMVSPDKVDVLRRMGLTPEVVVPDVQALLDAEWSEIQQAARDAQAGVAPVVRMGVQDPAFYTSYKQLSEIVGYLNTLSAAHPTMASTEVVGTSLEGRNITAIRVTAPDQPGNARDDRPVIIWHAGQHAREWVSPPVMVYLADMLLNSYATDPRVQTLLDSVDMRIIPVFNPDGYVYTWTDQRLWRKNRRGGYGVDLNRNWAYEWGGAGSSGSTSSETYRGPAPFSEPESAAVRDYALAFGSRLAAAMDYHSYSQLILWPFGYASGAVTPEPDRTFYDTLSTQMSNDIFSVHGAFYDPIQSWELYPAAGVAEDWYYGTLGAWSLTIELRDTGAFGFQLPANQILATCEENFEGALRFAERTALPLSFAQEHIPATIPADTAADVAVRILPGTQSVLPGTALLHARLPGGSFASAPLTAAGGDLYEGSLPPTPCGDEVEFYFSVQTTSGSTLQHPSAGPGAPFFAEATQIAVAFEDTMESNLGWTVGAPGDTATTGIWERANPQGTAAQPEDDHTPDGTLCWITGAASGGSVGANDIDGGATTLTGPSLDAAAGDGDAYISYWRWYSNDQGAAPNADSMPVLISNNNGSTWTLLEDVTENRNAWTFREFRVADFVTPTDQVRLRFVARDLDAGSIVEAGVDDVQLTFRGCPASNPADCDGNGVLSLDDLDCFIAAFTANDPAGDCDGNGLFTLDDLDCFINAFAGG